MKAITLEGANVAITGAARGIGLATARAFAAKGAKVWIGDLDAAEAKVAAESVGGQGFALDVRSKQSFADFLGQVDGPLDILVNNAGIMPMGSFLEEDDKVTEAILDINTLGPIWGMKLALPGMVERGQGHVINVASYMGKVPLAGVATYSASKHATLGLSEAVRDELAGTGVTVTAVLPSAVRTELVSGVQLGGVLPTVDPEDIANGIVKSCRTREPVMAIPGWMRQYELIAAIAPDTLVGKIRGSLARKRTLEHLDQGSRASYQNRVRKLSSSGDEG
ncbi:SDR family oxidoreductase [Marinobacter sp. SS21]|uniref:SDR family oxidoreductase n=1 Tax=Marinobacter sp. SS21 TaxID=2979460 RepID=UPI00232B4CC9|nr:SDR family oxidoreductase [Marinobacter sp. SS21]MDC0663579.1 SDR family oxidoreductase [Marinobacter sp. SS21]